MVFPGVKEETVEAPTIANDPHSTAGQSTSVDKETNIKKQRQAQTKNETYKETGQTMWRNVAAILMFTKQLKQRVTMTLD